MSESLRCSKSRTQHHGQNGHNDHNGQNQHQHHTIPHKFSSIVNKVESLIHKMNHDKHQVNQKKSAKNSTKKEKNKKKSISAPTPQECLKCEEQQLNASLDSLNNLTDNEDAEVENENGLDTNSLNNHQLDLTDSDDAEIAHITGTTAVQIHRRIELDQLNDETIREFNEQCSSLSHDMEFYNSWQNEDEMEKQSTELKESDNCDAELETQDLLPHYPDNKQTDSNNNHAQYSDNMSEEAQEWLEREEQIAIKEYQNYGTLGRRPITHIQQIVNDLTQQQSSPETMSPNYTSHNNNNNNNNSNNNSPTHFSDLTNYALNQLSQNGNGTGNGSGKTRRSSVASSGSMGRMETIVEEPSENKISVKEILQRFETMNKNEVICLEEQNNAINTKYIEIII